AAAATGPRGVPWRRFLPAFAPAGALGPHEGRSGGWFADGVADHRNAGRRRFGLYPDKCDFDYRWADLSGSRSLLWRCAPGGERWSFGVPRWRRRTDQGDAPG